MIFLVNWLMRVARGRRMINAVVIAIAGALAIVILSIWQYRRIQDNGATIRLTNQILFQAGIVSHTAMQYELDVKNFLLTGDSGFLRAAHDSAGVLPAELNMLKTLTADNLRQQQRIDSLMQYIRRNPQAPEQAGGAAAAGYSFRIRSAVAGIEAEQRLLLEQRRRANQLRASELQWALWLLTAALAVVAVLLYRTLRTDLGREQMAREISEEKYKTLFYKSPLARWVSDEKTLQLLEANEAALQMYGYTQEEFLRLTVADLRPPEDVPTLMSDLAEVRKDPQIHQVARRRHRRKNGEVFDVQVTAHSIEFEGRRARMVAVIDITERNRYERQLQQLNADLTRRAAELAASNAELERFAYIASHDLQEPLRMVSSFLQLLQKKYAGRLDAKADQYIHYAVDGAERMKALIMDLLEYSRVGTGKENWAWVDTAEVMAEMGEVFREKIVAARARVEVGPLPKVWGDKVQLTQLFQNLLSNALKYASDRPPLIRVGAKEEEACWLFQVADNGIGIDPLFFDKIFIIFQRLHNKSDYSGTGIGLAICKKIVERHGGKIWVESDRQQGSVFYFTVNKFKP